MLSASLLFQAASGRGVGSQVVSDIVTSSPEGNVICKVLKEEVVSDFLTVLNELYWIRLSTTEAEKALETQRLRLEAGRDISTGPETGALEDKSTQDPPSDEGNKHASKTAVSDLCPSKGHWEERNLTTPALKQLETFLNRISGKVFCLNGQCTVELEDIRVSGEATMTLKGKKNFVTYEFDIKCQWKAISRTPEGVYMADAKGDLRVVNFSSLSLDDLQVEVDCDDFSHPARRRLLDAVRNEGASFLEQELRRWVSNVFCDTDAL